MLPIIKQPLYDIQLKSIPDPIKYRGFTVEEEKILLQSYGEKNKDKKYNSIIQVVNNCTLGEIEVEKLASYDVEYLFVKIVSKSLGEISKLKYKCSNKLDNGDECGGVVDINLDLDKVELTENKNTNNVIEFDTNDGIGVTMTPPSLDKSKHITDDINNQFEVLFSCIESIFDSDNVYKVSDTPEEEFNSFCNSLSTTQKMKLVEWLHKLPTLETTVHYECPSCGNKGKLELEGIDDFFM